MYEQITALVYRSCVLVLLGEYGFLYGVVTLWILSCDVFCNNNVAFVIIYISI
jgi:hypothetical protein